MVAAHTTYREAIRQRRPPKGVASLWIYAEERRRVGSTGAMKPTNMNYPTILRMWSDGRFREQSVYFRCAKQTFVSCAPHLYINCY